MAFWWAYETFSKCSFIKTRKWDLTTWWSASIHVVFDLISWSKLVWMNVKSFLYNHETIYMPIRKVWHIWFDWWEARRTLFLNRSCSVRWDKILNLEFHFQSIDFIMIKNSKVWLILSLTVKFQKLLFSLLNTETHFVYKDFSYSKRIFKSDSYRCIEKSSVFYWCLKCKIWLACSWSQFDWSKVCALKWLLVSSKMKSCISWLPEVSLISLTKIFFLETWLLTNSQLLFYFPKSEKILFRCLWPV